MKLVVDFVPIHGNVYMLAAALTTLVYGQINRTSWSGGRIMGLASEGSNPKGTRLYFVILLKNVEKIFDWH